MDGHRPVIKDQPGWVQPDHLKIYALPNRGAVHDTCNDPRSGGKGSHYSPIGLHLASYQDRGCYIYNPERSTGYVIYLEGDTEALEHEKEHHLHGPRHARPTGYVRYGRISMKESLMMDRHWNYGGLVK
jgi:hypothetical protein